MAMIVHPISSRWGFALGFKSYLIVALALAIIIVFSTTQETIDLRRLWTNAQLQQYTLPPYQHDGVEDEATLRGHELGSDHHSSVPPGVTANKEATGGNSTTTGRTEPKSMPLLFHFILTTAEETFHPQTSRAIESALYHHPDAAVVVHANSMTLKPIQHLVNAGYNISVQKYDLESVIMTTAGFDGTMVDLKNATDFIAQLPKYNSTPYWPNNESNILRLCLLYLHGGVYLDNDVITVRSFDGLKNVLGVEVGTQANNAVLKFEKNNTFISACINDFLSNIKPYVWGANGPSLVTRVLTQKQFASCQGREEDCAVTVLPQHAFQPMRWRQVESNCFGRQATDKDLVQLRHIIDTESYAVHLNNFITKKFWAQNNSTKNGTLCNWLLNAFSVVQGNKTI